MAVEVFNFEKKRTFGGALLVTFVYLIIGGLLGGIIAGVLQMGNATASFEEGMSKGMQIGAYVSVVYVSILAFAIIKKKSIFNNFWAIFCGLISVIGALLAGCLGAFIPLTILSMFENNNN